MTTQIEGVKIQIVVDNLMDVIIDFIEIEKIVKLFKKVVDNAFKKC